MIKSLLIYLVTAQVAYPPLGPTVTVEPTSDHTHTMIFLHGIGGSGEQQKHWFVPGGALANPNLKVVLPTAPV